MEVYESSDKSRSIELGAAPDWWRQVLESLLFRSSSVWR